MATKFYQDMDKVLEAIDNAKTARRVHAVLLLVHGAIVVVDLLHRVLS